MIYFRTKRLIFRDWKDSDTLDFQRMNRDRDVRRYYAEKQLPYADSKKKMEEYQKHIEDRGFGFFAVEHKRTGDFLGYIGITVLDENGPYKLEIFPCVEVRWMLKKKYWNQGIATEAAVGLMRFVERNTNIKELFALFPAKNTALLNVLKKIGMEPYSEFEHPLIIDGHSLKRFLIYKRVV